ncbi:MAG: hypothetical protein Ta2G_00690 [Termitinemataceae bacterium]|nr:MAG: hypothetical protein Ta2G_00690 [Termitinemataceae bacterium]
MKEVTNNLNLPDVENEKLPENQIEDIVDSRETSPEVDLLSELQDIKALLLTSNEQNKRISYIGQWNHLCHFAWSLSAFFNYYDSPSNNGFDKMVLPQYPIINNSVNQMNKIDKKTIPFHNYELAWAQEYYKRVSGGHLQNSQGVIYFEYILLNTYATGMMRNKVFKKCDKDLKKSNDFNHHRFILPLLIIYALAIHFRHFLSQSITKEHGHQLILFADRLSPTVSITEKIYEQFGKLEKICKDILWRLTDYHSNYNKEDIIANERYLIGTQLQITALFTNQILNTPMPSLFNLVNVQKDIKKTINRVDYFCPGKTVTFHIDTGQIKQVEEFIKHFHAQCEELGRKLHVSGSKDNNFVLTEIQNNAIDHVHRAWKEKLKNGQRKAPICALDMGTGKTVVACEIIKQFRDNTAQEVSSYILVIVKAATIPNTWEKELYGYFPSVTFAIKEDRNSYFNAVDDSNVFQSREIVVTSYDTAINDIQYYIKHPPALIVYDEIQCINSSKRISNRCRVLSELNAKVDYKMALSGTPAQNTIDEFLITYFFLNDYSALKKWFNHGKTKEALAEKEQLRSETIDILTKGNFYLFSMLDFKNKEYQSFIPIEMHQDMYTEYTRLTADDEQKNEKMIEQFIINPQVLRDEKYIEQAEQFEIHTNIVSRKIEMTKTIIANLPKDDKIIVFSFFIKPLKILEKELADFSPLLLVGKSNDEEFRINFEKAKKDKDVIDEFNAENRKHRVLLTTLKKSGEGLNLQSANHVIILDLWWNPMTMLQAIARIRRQNQQKDIFSYILVYTKPKDQRPEKAQIFTNDGQWSSDYVVFEDYHKLQIMQKKLKEYNDFVAKLGFDVPRTLPTPDGEMDISDATVLKFLDSIGAITKSSNQSQNNQPTIRFNPDLLNLGPIPQTQVFFPLFWDIVVRSKRAPRDNSRGALESPRIPNSILGGTT